MLLLNDTSLIYLNSGPTETGMSRLSLSDSDKQARDWFAVTTESLGCKVTTDSMGNQFAVRPGLQDGPPTYAGSHLDTQPTVRPNSQTRHHLGSCDGGNCDWMGADVS